MRGLMLTTDDHDVDPYPFPARGRKPLRFEVQLITVNVDPYLFPARGRKLVGQSWPVKVVWRNVDPYLFPARGRKL